MNYREANRFLDSLINYERTVPAYNDFKLERFKNLLEDLGDPHKKLKNVILVAGTKGKGSVCHFLESTLHICGLKTGLFSKPHLLSIRERIKVLTKPIPEADFSRLVIKIKAKVKKHRCTFFEAITAITFLYFLENDLDYTILEVGLGGRLDSTNVTEPIISVITLIGFDHTEVLGDSLSKIATEKAAIIHNNGYIVSSKQKPIAINVIKNRIKNTNSQLFLIGRDLNISREKLSINGSKFRINCDKAEREFSITVLGKHQIANAATTIGVLQRLMTLDKRINWNGILQGFKKAQIPARCQIVSQKPLIMIDVAHNPDSALALFKTIRKIFNKDIALIFGSSKEKLVNKMLKILLPITNKVILTKADSPRAYDPKNIAQLIKPYSIPFQITESVKEAIGEALKIASKNEMIVITGSFFVAGEALQILKIEI